MEYLSFILISIKYNVPIGSMKNVYLELGSYFALFQENYFWKLQ